MEDCIVRPTKLPPFYPTKYNHVYVIPNGCHKESGIFNKWRRFGTPYLTRPQTPCLDPPLALCNVFIPTRKALDFKHTSQ